MDGQAPAGVALAGACGTEEGVVERPADQQALESFVRRGRHAGGGAQHHDAPVDRVRGVHAHRPWPTAAGHNDGREQRQLRHIQQRRVRARVGEPEHARGGGLGVGRGALSRRRAARVQARAANCAIAVCGRALAAARPQAPGSQRRARSLVVVLAGRQAGGQQRSVPWDMATRTFF